MDNYENPKPGKTCISPSLEAFGQQERRVRIVSKVIQSPDVYAFAKAKDETVLAALYQRRLAALETLKKSLLHQAFTGQL